MAAALAISLMVLGQLLASDMAAYGISLFGPICAGLMLRHPSIVSWPFSGGACVGVVLSYVVMGAPWAQVAMHATAELAALLVVWHLLVQVTIIEGLREFKAMLRVVLACALGAAVGGLCLLVLGAVGPDAHRPNAAIDWLLGHWAGYTLLLPATVLMPRLLFHDRRLPSMRSVRIRLLVAPVIWPLAFLGVSLVVSWMLGGPGAVAILAPALLYCALVYSQGSVAWLGILLAGAFMLLARWGADSGLAGSPLVGDNPLSAHSLQVGLVMLFNATLLVSATLAARNDQIAALSRALDHDDLTGALSREAFMRGAQEYLQLSPAPRHGNGFLMLDIDHFKQLNDAHGHAVGDNVLREFARVVHSAVRSVDLFGRLGGEEFGIILPDTAPADLLTIAERLRQSVERIRLYYDSEAPLQITVSIGAIHDSQIQPCSLEALMLRADVAMYGAKRDGRNQVCVHPA